MCMSQRRSLRQSVTDLSVAIHTVDVVAPTDPHRGIVIILRVCPPVELVKLWVGFPERSAQFLLSRDHFISSIASRGDY